MTLTAQEEETAVYLADFDRCEPAELLSAVPRRGHWRMVPYETRDFSGTMLIAGEETAAPEVTYPLKVEGWHEIYIGVLQERFEGAQCVQVKLSGDPAFSVITLQAGPQRDLQEIFWKAADLTGQTLSFRQLVGALGPEGRLEGYPGLKAKLAYVKLVSLSPERVQAVLADRSERENRRLFAHNDANGFIWLYRATEPEDIYREIEPYRNTDFRRLYWEAGMGDMLYYPGKSGRLLTSDDVEDFQNIGGRLYAQAWRTIRDKGIDPLRLAADFAHDIGLEFHACYRTAGFYFPPPEDHWNRGGFYEAHPELRAVAADGQRLPRISYSYPETQAYVLSVLREIASYPVDGIALLFIRRPPLSVFEPPLVEGFQQAYGLDPRDLDERDPRWLAYRCHVLTDFMTQVRREMDALGAERGRRIEITAVVSGREEENFFYGMDLPEWVRRGLVDTVIPYTMAPDLDSVAVSWPDVTAAEYWVDLVRDTGCQLAASILPRLMPVEEFRRMAHGLYEVGVENLFFWDSDARITGDRTIWNTVTRLGHKNELAEWKRAGEPTRHPGSLQPTRLGDWVIASDSHDTPG